MGIVMYIADGFDIDIMGIMVIQVFKHIMCACT